MQPAIHTVKDAIRAMAGRKGAYTLHATHDPRETTKAARAAFRSKFERGHGKNAVRVHLAAEYARKAFYVGMALKSAQVRAARKKARMEAADRGRTDDPGGGPQ